MAKLQCLAIPADELSTEREPLTYREVLTLLGRHVPEGWFEDDVSCACLPALIFDRSKVVPIRRSS